MTSCMRCQVVGCGVCIAVYFPMWKVSKSQIEGSTSAFGDSESQLATDAKDRDSTGTLRVTKIHLEYSTFLSSTSHHHKWIIISCLRLLTISKPSILKRRILIRRRGLVLNLSISFFAFVFTLVDRPGWPPLFTSISPEPSGTEGIRLCRWIGATIHHVFGDGSRRR